MFSFVAGWHGAEVQLSKGWHVLRVKPEQKAHLLGSWGKGRWKSLVVNEMLDPSKPYLIL